MRNLIALLAGIGLMTFLNATKVQNSVYSNEKIEYTVELPSPTWRVTSEPDAVHQHVEFIYGDRLSGFLAIRKEVIDAGTTLADLARHDQEQRLRYLPGYVEGKQEPFSGRLDGLISSYEFVNTGKPMLGRIYYLQVDNRTVYALHFTGLRDKLTRIRNQTDMIARSFKLK